jgi:hypothetical protein
MAVVTRGPMRRFGRAKRLDERRLDSLPRLQHGERSLLALTGRMQRTDERLKEANRLKDVGDGLRDLRVRDLALQELDPPEQREDRVVQVVHDDAAELTDALEFLRVSPAVCL